MWNCLNWSQKCVKVDNQRVKVLITDTKLYVSVVTLSTQDKTKLLEQLKSAFTRTINWNNHQSKTSTEKQNQYLVYLIGPSFKEVNSLFVLLFEDEAQRTSYKQYYLPVAEIKNYNIMTDRQSFFDQPVRNILIIYDSIRIIATGQGSKWTR